MMQEKLNLAKRENERLHEEVTQLRTDFADKTRESDDNWSKWQRAKMQGEEAILKLNKLWEDWNEEMILKEENARKYRKMENMFYAFVGFCYILTEEKKERERREQEARRDAV